MRESAILLLPFAGALLLWCAAKSRNTQTMAAALAPAIALALTLSLLPDILHGQVFAIRHSWIPALGLQYSLRIDGLSFLFLLLILAIGLLVILYAHYYLSPHENQRKFYSLLLLFMGAMVGLVTAGNLLLLLVFWELTSLVSFLLISFWGHRSDARKGARMALAVTGGGGLALMAGVLLLGHIAGSYELEVILAMGEAIQSHPLYLPMLLLILLGAFTKSAQFPFHFWLPHAMAAPTPVSAYLHSATMVKAGVFLLARLYPVLAGTDTWFYLVCGTGLVTLLMGAYIALYKHDLKGLLAYSTISHLGLITLLLGMGTRLSAVAAIFHIINHAIFKASLFMAAGIIDHETGSRDMRKINGLWHYMPHTATLAMVAAAAMAGVPLLNGFLSKEMFFAEALSLELPGYWEVLAPLLATLAGIFAVAYSARFIHDVFFNGEPLDLPRFPPHEPPRYMKIPVEILVAACILVGIFPNFAVGPILDAAAMATLGGTLPDYNIAILHGVNWPLMMSITALLGGLFMYSQRARLFAWHERLPEFDEKLAFDRSINGLHRLARALIQLVENQQLSRYLWLLSGFLLLLLWQGVNWQGMALSGMVRATPLDPVTGIAIVLLVVASLATAACHRRRLLALLLMSLVGLLVAMGFARFSAPDLALTQLSVEVVTIILLMLALYFLPPETPRESSRYRRWRDLLIALVAGTGMTTLAFAMLTRKTDTLADFFLTQSLPAGGGANVVNVILVDFRGFDTLGEISVLAIAAVGIYRMLSGLQLSLPGTDGEGRHWTQERHPPLLMVLSRPLLPLILMVAFYILLRGHNLPGGGFIAGLVVAVGIILQYIANGVSWSQARIRIGYRPLLGIGLLLATATGLGSWLLGYPFLTSSFGHIRLPFIGELELATAMLFDLGVFCTVIGATLLTLATLGELTSVSGTRSKAEAKPKPKPKPKPKQSASGSMPDEDAVSMHGLQNKSTP